ncbi:LysR family transcriptional regulator [Sporomusa termitida]|uniref:HTH-type transcriptional regulator ArgP n=1 Tax=Sporomusa termitida TaxID=2377 RepID=A0A517DYS7_9FIRM|nr:LysR family transcriptional regulator [Sporomusa termitida]QDR82509.1 HTH-type transcriptional regulator ArgP [Sporomusa termitida]
MCKLYVKKVNFYNVLLQKNHVMREKEVIDLTIWKYQVFSAIVASGSMAKAAELLNLSQSGVSHALASLEGEFGFPLLTRDRSGISLTSNGTQVLPHIRQILHYNERLKQELAAIAGLTAGTVRIGTFTSVSMQWLPEIITQFHHCYPAITIELLDGNYDEIEEWIKNGSVDFGFVSLPTMKLYEIIPLKKDRLLCILPPHHPLRQQSMITFADIKEEPFIATKWGSYDEIKRLVNEHNVKLKIQYEVTEARAIITMVKNGLGISILPEMTLLRAVDTVYTVGLEHAPARTIGIAALSIKNSSPAARKFIDSTKVWLTKHHLMDF